MLTHVETLEEILTQLDTLYEEVAFAPGEAAEIVEMVNKIKVTAQQITRRFHRRTNQMRGYDD